MKTQKLPWLHIPRLVFAATNPKASQYFNPVQITRAKAKYIVVKRDNFKCEVCGSKNRLTIDHVKEKQLKNQSERRLASCYTLEKCETLCTRCHGLKNNGVSLYSNPY